MPVVVEAAAVVVGMGAGARSCVVGGGVVVAAVADDAVADVAGDDGVAARARVATMFAGSAAVYAIACDGPPFPTHDLL